MTMRAVFARRGVRLLGCLLATAAILAPLCVMWVHSLVPSTYSVMDMGYLDYGGGPPVGDGGHGGHGRAHSARPGVAAAASQVSEVSVASLTGPQTGTPDVEVTLVARKENFRLRSGEELAGYTLNRTSPGPTIRARQGDLVQVTLRNDNIPDGTTLHWHGIDVPSAEDGVAGVTQDAVGIGDQKVYRFVAQDAGTYWYHSHQVSHEQVRKGLFGAFVIDPANAASTDRRDVLAVAHSYGGIRTINGGTGQQHVAVLPRTTIRLRVVNTDDGPFHAWVTGTSYAVIAMDGFDLHEPTQVSNRSLLVAAGGRADLELTTPGAGSSVRVDLGGGGNYLTLGAKREITGSSPTPSALARSAARPKHAVDLLAYGSRRSLGFDPAKADRNFDYRIGRRFGFVDGKPGLWWSINGHLFPNVPMFLVAEGDIVRMTIKNKSGQVHPMHLHGHHAVVLSRNGKPAVGSPWWVDSLNVANGETYDIAFRADNPGIWMDHCHNLAHAAEGLAAHLAYAGVTQPFVIGGKAHNHPE